MGAYVDPLMVHARRNKLGHQWAHLMADSLTELHGFARAIGVHRCWFHRDHYDLNPEQREKAVLHGAAPVSHRYMVALRAALREAR
jgi:hypothetical protein